MEDLIKEAKAKARDLGIYEKIFQVRKNAEKWGYWNFWKIGMDNYGLIMKGMNGTYWIRYKEININWIDNYKFSIYLDDKEVLELVYKAELYGFIKQNNLKKIMAFVNGPWVSIINELWEVAKSPIPENPPKKERWKL